MDARDAASLGLVGEDSLMALPENGKIAVIVFVNSDVFTAIEALEKL